MASIGLPFGFQREFDIGSSLSGIAGKVQGPWIVKHNWRSIWCNTCSVVRQFPKVQSGGINFRSASLRGAQPRSVLAASTAA